ncbi:uncharacterized protein LOC119606587 [Lucilia sericata]|uniref:uncharacterized protein LOC119606587 n=1 Tax=Lucilia sericata TaxID=13632 RepID=UPI0018A7EB7C|nr:uncharacterized protein LOC119606587 [Lucilia sericata]
MDEVSTKFLFKVTAKEIHKYKNDFVHFSNTRIVAYYERLFKNIKPATRIRYFIEPPRGSYKIDLNDGYKEYVMTSLYSKGVDLCLKYVMSSPEEPEIKNKTKVFTRSGTLVHIMESIRSKKDRELLIRVTRYRGNIYMITGDSQKSEEMEGDKVVESPTETHHNQIKRYFLADSPHDQPNIKEPWNENKELLAVFRSNLKKYDIIYSGSVQGIIAKQNFKDFDNMDQLNKCRFVLIKQMWNDIDFKSQKFLHYLFHAHLSKVNDIFVAYKNRKGIVTLPLEHKIVKNFPKHLVEKLSIGEAFLFDFLQRIENLMSNVNCLNTVYVFKIKRNINCISYQIYEGKTEKSFIMDEYKEYCEF